MSALTSFLNNALKKYKAGSFSKITVVKGNEACDLDTMVSSVTLAYLRSQTQSETDLTLPLIPIVQKDFPLRTEAKFLFNKIGLAPKDLIFRDSVPTSDLERLANEKKLSIILVDHNALDGDYTRLAPCVTEIIDHHEDLKQFTECKKLIEMVGSASTLVASHILEAEKAGQIKITEPLRTLLLGTILLDTANLDPKMGRVKDKDIAVATDLMKGSSINQEELFAQIQKAKFDSTGLSCKDLLRKDFKQWSQGNVRYGISSVLLPIDDFIKTTSDLVSDLEAHRLLKTCDILVVMHAFSDKDGKFTRQLIIYAPKKELGDDLVPLEQSELGLEKYSSDVSASYKAPLFKFFNQTNIKCSRKKVQPLMHGIYGSKL